ncbi:hypothetical protein B4166_3747 [Caldibacillus thermoamylovorans]|uniref:Transposase n=1 Tax=Caldibacillus thermoamylovorans TaxID=35841 RepID=A0ABD4A8V7_9BACI|nr:hypothetical protein B4166_3747 [Caldibacillus thermoamylovorans]KIO73045.1 hypothetical protein B4167_2502 [Caldibacillus thermoamylovorans]
MPRIISFFLDRVDQVRNKAVTKRANASYHFFFLGRLMSLTSF